MKRQLIIATLALSTAALSACGSSEDQAKDAGKQVGESIAHLQNFVMARPAEFEIEGIQRRLDDVQGQLPEDTFKQLGAAHVRLQAAITQAENHPEEIDSASQAALAQFDAVSGDGKNVAAFKEGVKEGYQDGSH